MKIGNFKTTKFGEFWVQKIQKESRGFSWIGNFEAPKTKSFRSFQLLAQRTKFFDTFNSHELKSLRGKAS